VEFYIYRHDGLARAFYCRIVDKTAKTCDECGQPRKTIYKYGILPEDRLSGIPTWQVKSFCGVSCMRQYCT